MTKEEFALSIRTDLALELLERTPAPVQNGIAVQEYTQGAIQITEVHLTTPEAAQKIGKPCGTYLTLHLKALGASSVPGHEEAETIAAQLKPLLPQQGTVLVVGLGNEHITPDALGPLCIDSILATRHLAEADPAFAAFRSVAAISPGVMGQTGMEASAVVAAVCKDIHPSAVIVIDALAACTLSRLGNTVQIANTGISPGAGVKNNRRELSEETLGVPVISVGIPTVVDCSTLLEELSEPQAEHTAMQGTEMVVTPRDIDLIVEHGAKLLALSINRALQPELSLEEISYLIA